MESHLIQKCLVIANYQLSERIKTLLTNQYSLITKIKIDNAFLVLRTNYIQCIIIHLDGQSKESTTKLYSLKKQFPIVPIIAISSNHHIDQIFKCGEIGIDDVISATDIRLLQEKVPKIINNKALKFSLSEFGIDIDNCPALIKEALITIERDYLNIMSVQEIAELMGISEYILSRKIKQYCLIGPKKLIMYFKLRHALSLMKNPGLNLNEVAYLSGFSNQKRFNESFKKILGQSPGKRRADINFDSIALQRQFTVNLNPDLNAINVRG